MFSIKKKERELYKRVLNGNARARGGLSGSTARREHRVVPFDWTDALTIEAASANVPLKKSQPTPSTVEPIDDAVGHTTEETVQAETAAATERWTVTEELACKSKCKRCHAPIQWGELIELRDTTHPSGRPPTKQDRKWVPLDPDFMPHGCAVQRRIER